MAESDNRKPQSTAPTIISIDAMGGDQGVKAVIGGMEISARTFPNIRFIVHGTESEIKLALRRKPALAAICELRATEDVITMDAEPSAALRGAKKSSMWASIETMKSGAAKAIVSCGNTGALMAMSTIQLRKMPGVNRPAIAIL